MAGTGLLITFLALIAEVFGLDLDEKYLTEAVNAGAFLFGFVLNIAGQLMRSDLKWGLIRKKPLE